MLKCSQRFIHTVYMVESLVSINLIAFLNRLSNNMLRTNDSLEYSRSPCV